MRRVSLSDPAPTETASQIAWHNLKVADEHHDLALFCGAAFGWFKAHPEANYPDLEKALREQKLQTHLIAVKVTAPKDGSWKLTPLPTPEGKTARPTPNYECTYSCRPSEAAKKELLQHWPSYETNLAALAEAGVRQVASAEDVKKAGGKPLPDDVGSTVNLVMRNEKKISISVTSAQQAIQHMEEGLAKACGGRKPDHVLVGISGRGEPIMGLIGSNASGEKMMGQIGYIVSGGGSMRLTGLRCLHAPATPV